VGASTREANAPPTFGLMVPSWEHAPPTFSAVMYYVYLLFSADAANIKSAQFMECADLYVTHYSTSATLLLTCSKVIFSPFISTFSLLVSEI